jgi:hypothetical protein
MINDLLNQADNFNPFTNPMHACTSGFWKFKVKDKTITAYRYGHNAGFCSDLNIQIDFLKKFYNTEELYNNYTVEINGVNAWINHHNNTECLYTKLFNQNKDKFITPPYTGPAHDERHEIYKNYDLLSLYHLLMKYYDFSEEQRSLYENIIKQYQINFDNTIAVCYRGTDKGGEVTLASPQEYINLTSRLLESDEKCRVLIQTDQGQVAELFKFTFKDKCIIIKEMPVTDSHAPIHQIYYKDINFTKNFNAVIRILANSKYLINHTGNTGLAIAGFRGSAENLYQFDACGVLQN